MIILAEQLGCHRCVGRSFTKSLMVAQPWCNVVVAKHWSNSIQLLEAQENEYVKFR